MIGIDAPIKVEVLVSHHCKHYLKMYAHNPSLTVFAASLEQFIVIYCASAVVTRSLVLLLHV